MKEPAGRDQWGKRGVDQPIQMGTAKQSVEYCLLPSYLRP
jgi:hypothetical protein